MQDSNFSTKKLASLIKSATGLAFCVVVLGAYTRLTDSGLGCPDWPGCYGQPIAPLNSSNAWIEMIHRYVAGSLGLLIFFITYKVIKLRKHANVPSKLTILIAIGVIIQAMLGMWTVTLKLYPVIVMAHFIGGILLLSVLWWIKLTIHPPHIYISLTTLPNKNNLSGLSICSTAVLFVQLLLGAWTSANYAALVCADFPTCQGQLWPTMDWYNAFNFSAAGIFNSPGIPLENPARVTIQVAHRLGALVTTMLVLLLSTKLILCRKNPKLRHLGISLIILLCIQITLGISNVLAGLPLLIAVLHNAIAALLFLSIVTVTFILTRKPQEYFI